MKTDFSVIPKKSECPFQVDPTKYPGTLSYTLSPMSFKVSFYGRLLAKARDSRQVKVEAAESSPGKFKQLDLLQDTRSSDNFKFPTTRIPSAERDSK